MKYRNLIKKSVGFATLIFCLASCQEAQFDERLQFENNRWEIDSITEVTAVLKNVETVENVNFNIQYTHKTAITQFDLAVEVATDDTKQDYVIAVNLTDEPECLGDLCDKKFVLNLEQPIESDKVKIRLTPKFPNAPYIPNIHSVKIKLD